MAIGQSGCAARGKSRRGLSFIARLCAHVRVNTLVPGSILQTAPGDYVILGRVAQDIAIHMT